MNIYLSVLSLLLVVANTSPMGLGNTKNKKQFPDEIEMAVFRDHTPVDPTPISENIVSSFLFEPEEYQARWGALYKDVNCLIVHKVLKMTPLMPWLMNRCPIPFSTTTYHWGSTNEEGSTLYQSIFQAHWSNAGDKVALDLSTGRDAHRYRVFDTVKERFHDLGDHPSFFADERVLSLKKGKPVEWCWNEKSRSYKQQPLSVDPKQCPLVDSLDGSRMRISNYQDNFENALHINLARSLNGQPRCVMDDARKKVLDCNQDRIFVWRLGVFDKKGRLKQPIKITSQGNKITRAQLNQNGHTLSIVYNDERIELIDLVTRRRFYQTRIADTEIKNCCYTNSGLALALGVGQSSKKEEVRVLFILGALGNRPIKLKSVKLENHYGRFLSSNPNGTKVLIEHLKGELALFNIEGLHEMIRFFEREITLEQAILLNCIKWAAAGRSRRFDFSRFPHLLGYYNSLPTVVKKAVAGIVKMPKVR